jgi:hypothetical protein
MVASLTVVKPTASASTTSAITVPLANTDPTSKTKIVFLICAPVAGAIAYRNPQGHSEQGYCKEHCAGDGGAEIDFFPECH